MKAYLGALKNSTFNPLHTHAVSTLSSLEKGSIDTLEEKKKCALGISMLCQPKGGVLYEQYIERPMVCKRNQKILSWTEKGENHSDKRK